MAKGADGGFARTEDKLRGHESVFNVKNTSVSVKIVMNK